MVFLSETKDGLTKIKNMTKVEFPNEEHKLISEDCFTSDYLITKSGRLLKVANVDKNRISEIAPIFSGGRNYFTLKVKGSHKRGEVFYRDELLASYFLLPPKEGQILIHLNNDYQDDRLENLKWGYPFEHVFLDCEWKWIDGFEGKYLIDINRKVYSINGKLIGFNEMPGSKCSLGYHVFSLRMPGCKKKDIRRHILVAKAFIPNPENKPGVNHKNGVKGDDRIENLEWATSLENSQHAVKTGLLDTKGEKSVMSKLKKEDVLEIRKLAANGLSHEKIAKNYPVSRRYVTSLINRETWNWL